MEEKEGKREEGDGYRPKEGAFARIEHHWIEIAAAAPMALATMMSAFSAYESASWNGVQTERYNRSNALWIQADELQDKANQEIAVDTDMFSNYIFSTLEGDTQVSRFFQDSAFSKELQAAFSAWLLTDPLHNPEAPETPFKMPQYKNGNHEKSQAMQERAMAEARRAKHATRNADNYILLTVLFASVLFFAGISTKFMDKRLKVIVLAGGAIVFIIAVVIVALQP